MISLLDLPDGEFARTFFLMPDEEVAALPDDVRKLCRERYRKLHSYVDETSQRLAREQARADARAAVAHASQDLTIERVLRDRLVDAHGESWRYVDVWGRWLNWTGTRWQPDSTREFLDLATQACADAADELQRLGGDPNKLAGILRLLGTAKTRSAVENLAREHRTCAATVDQFDADPWLLATPGGTVDLRTGVLRAADPADHITRCTAVAPGGESPCWDRVVLTAMGGSGELVEYLQRALGSSLAGVTRDHVMFFGHGLGANGKTTILGTVHGVLGDYAAVCPMEALLESKSDRHPTDLAGLRGARFVFASEIEEGRRWATSRVKSLTGGDPIAARYMRQDYFTFRPEFKLWIAGNHRPGLRDVDEAMRRRLHLIPFTVTIPPEGRDPNLGEKLRAEWPGILQWLVDGCAAWQAEGLRPPGAVLDVSSAYLSNEDVISTWVDDCTVTDRAAATSIADLRASYEAWATRAGERFLGARRLAQALEDRGFQRERATGGVRCFRGLRLKATLL